MKHSILDECPDTLHGHGCHGAVLAFAKASQERNATIEEENQNLRAALEKIHGDMGYGSGYGHEDVTSDLHRRGILVDIGTGGVRNYVFKWTLPAPSTEEREIGAA